jgi:putative ABC transport system substrate-binding protein
MVGAASLSTPVHSDETGIRRIGVLYREGEGMQQIAASGLRNGLHELGYVEGKNVAIDWKGVLDPTDEKLRAIVVDWARSHTDVIVALGTPEARAALQATTLPVVFVAGDPVGTGLAQSLAHPGGRGTGVSMLNRELAGKRMELLRQVAPGVRRIAFLMNPSNPLDARMLEEAYGSARALGLKLTVLEARTRAELDVRLRAMSRSAADGLLVSNDQLFLTNRVEVTQAVRKITLPAIFPFKEYHVPFKEYHGDGALMSYGPSGIEGTRKAAAYVAKILEGAQPGNLPIEQISSFELVIDLRVAREMQIKVPQELLYRANEVIR